MKIDIPFTHRQSAHCETGALSNLLTHHGLALSEAMVFGIGSGLFFGYFPFIRLNHLPLTAFRVGTGGIIKRVTRRLGARLEWEKFRSPEKAMAALDRRLEEGIAVGCRAGAFWLPYFPRRYRFHFNMHNLVVFGVDGDDYRISDPVFPEPVTCSRSDLARARFAKGAMPPRGRMYHVAHVPENPDLKSAVIAGIREVCRTHTQGLVPFVGARGIRYLSGRLRRWPERLGEKRAALHLGQIIRMQEEIGTGGAGFRFLYAAFLQEAAEILENPALQALSEEMTAVGDRWRDFAVIASRICKHRASETETYPAMADILLDCARMEAAILRALSEAVARRPTGRATPAAKTASSE